MNEKAKRAEEHVETRQAEVTKDTTPVEQPGKNDEAIDAAQTNETSRQPAEFIGDGVRSEENKN